MTRPVFPFYASDISALARSLNQQITESGHLPGHLEILNMLARNRFTKLPAFSRSSRRRKAAGKSAGSAGAGGLQTARAPDALFRCEQPFASVAFQVQSSGALSLGAMVEASSEEAAL
jgi:hypothetical protein